MENKQTAVEWLKLQLETYGDPQYCELTWKELDELCEQAKEMELAQRIDDYTNGHIDREKNLLRLPKRNTSSLPIDEDMTDWDEDMTDWDATLNDGLEDL